MVLFSHRTKNSNDKVLRTTQVDKKNFCLTLRKPPAKIKKKTTNQNLAFVARQSTPARPWGRSGWS